jgi:hypothetical protein
MCMHAFRLPTRNARHFLPCVRKPAYIISHTPHHTGISRFPPQLWRDCTGPITSIVMAQRPREDVVDHVPVQPTPPPSFLSLPDLAHHTIASFLPGHSRDEPSRLRVSEVSSALLESYGGILEWMRLQYIEDSSADRLCALLQRHKKLEQMDTGKQEIMPAFCQAIVQGCCQGVECMTFFYHEEMRPESVSALVGALEIVAAHVQGRQGLKASPSHAEALGCELSPASWRHRSPSWQERWRGARLHN